MSLRSNSMHITAGGPWTNRWHGPTKTHLCRRENVPAFQTWDVANPRTTEPILFLLQFVEFHFYFNLLNFLSLVYRWDCHFEIYLFKIYHFNISADTLGFVSYPWICLLPLDLSLIQGWWTQEPDQACPRTSLLTSYLHKNQQCELVMCPILDHDFIIPNVEDKSWHSVPNQSSMEAEVSEQP